MIDALTDELTDAVQDVASTFPGIKADNRPVGIEIYRWLFYEDATSKVIGIIALEGPQECALSMHERKVLLRKKALDLLHNYSS